MNELRARDGFCDIFSDGDACTASRREFVRLCDDIIEIEQPAYIS